MRWDEKAHEREAQVETQRRSPAGTIVVSFLLCITYVDLVTTSVGCSTSDGGGPGDAAVVDSSQGDVASGGDTGSHADAEQLADGPALDGPPSPDAGSADGSPSPDAAQQPDASTQPDASIQPDASGPDAA